MPMPSDTQTDAPDLPDQASAMQSATQKDAPSQAMPQADLESESGSEAQAQAQVDPDPDPDPGERLPRLIARAGLCSRREAERWITGGRVRIDNKVVTGPAVLVPPGARVTVDGKPLPEAEPVRLWRYHKPVGLITSHRDPDGRATVFDHLPGALPRVISVGRLDLNSEGLLLLTNDGALARRLEHPETGWLRRYRVRVHGRPDPNRLEALMGGITVEGVRYGPIEARLERQQGANAWLVVTLQEGKNREIRRVMEHLGHPVSRLIRVAYGPFQLGHLAAGKVEEIPGKVLREQLGRPEKVGAGRRTGAASPKTRSVSQAPGGATMTPGTAPQGKAGNAKAGNAKAGRAQVGRAQAEEAKAGGTKAGGTKAGWAKAKPGRKGRSGTKPPSGPARRSGSPSVSGSRRQGGEASGDTKAATTPSGRRHAHHRR